MAVRKGVGEASIFQDDDGRWHGWITVGTRANGKPDRRQCRLPHPRSLEEPRILAAIAVTSFRSPAAIAMMKS